mgnify:CR=1 FL=1
MYSAVIRLPLSSSVPSFLFLIQCRVEYVGTFACCADGGRVQISLCSYSCSANMLGAQGLRISCVVTKQDFSIAKIVIKYPPRKQKVKSKLHPNHKCCKSEYHPATLPVLECRHSSAHSWNQFSWNHPVCQIAFLVYLQSSQNRSVNMSASYDCKRSETIEINSAI